MKNSESLKEFKKLKQATRQLNETHKFKIIKKQLAQLLTLSKGQSPSSTISD